jgi:hypothetical protein
MRATHGHRLCNVLAWETTPDRIGRRGGVNGVVASGIGSLDVAWDKRRIPTGCCRDSS